MVPKGKMSVPNPFDSLLPDLVGAGVHEAVVFAADLVGRDLLRFRLRLDRRGYLFSFTVVEFSFSGLVAAGRLARIIVGVSDLDAKRFRLPWRFAALVVI